MALIMGILIFLLAMVSYILSWVGVAVFLDFQSFIFVLLANIALLIATKSAGDFWYGVKVAYKKGTEWDRPRIKKAIKAIELLQKSVLGICILGFLMGVVIILAGLEEPMIVGPAVGLILFTVIYSVLLNLVILNPVKYVLRLGLGGQA